MENIHGEKVPLDSRHRHRLLQTQGHPIREEYTAGCRHTKPSGNIIDRGYSKWILEEGHMQRLRTFYRYLQKLPVFSLSRVETNQPSPQVIVSGLLGSLQPLEPQLGRREQALPTCSNPHRRPGCAAHISSHSANNKRCQESRIAWAVLRQKVKLR